MSDSADVTDLLVAWSAGDEAAHSRLIDAVYHELRGLARGYLRRERADHSLAPTALVHEAYLKLIDQRQVRWQNRAHFFAIAAHLMRRILVDHARTRGAAKRDGGQRVPLQDVQAVMDPPEVDVLDLDAALDKLSSLDQRQSQLVELRFFGGLTVDEAAAVMGIAPATVDRDWALARHGSSGNLGANGGEFSSRLGACPQPVPRGHPTSASGVERVPRAGVCGRRVPAS